jgi:mRNA-degrading endonuclease YafQ of YafQ-DinJ toxin-antitoxin module
VRRLLLRSNTFVRAARRATKQNPALAGQIQTTLDRLAADAFQPALKTQRLKGQLTGSLACSAGYDLRILFKIVSYQGIEAILLETIGSHDEVY